MGTDGQATVKVPLAAHIWECGRLDLLCEELQARSRHPRAAHLSRGKLCNGAARDQSELARLARVTQPRMSQIMNLNFLAPEIQEAILFRCGDSAVWEKTLRPVAIEPSWAMQRRIWRGFASDPMDR
jgi:hypothetical protein